MNRNRRLRSLFFLTISAFVMVLCGLLALQWRAHHLAPSGSSQLLFPDLGANLHTVTEIRIETRQDGIINIVFQPLRGWVLTRRGDYPASFDTVRRMLTALTQITTVEPRTARPDWFHYVNLDAPPTGDGTRITVLDSTGHALADLIVGKKADAPDRNNGAYMFVRKTTEQQSWLARSPYDMHISPDNWFERHVIALAPENVAQLEFLPIYGPPYVLRRNAPGHPFDLFGTSRASFIKAPPAMLADYAGKLTDITFTDAGPQGQFLFSSRTAKIRVRTFDGLAVNISVIRIGADYWARIDASSAPGKSQAEKRATDINAMAFDWAFKLKPAQGALFMTSLDGVKRRIAANAKERSKNNPGKQL